MVKNPEISLNGSKHDGGSTPDMTVSYKSWDFPRDLYLAAYRSDAT